MTPLIRKFLSDCRGGDALDMALIFPFYMLIVLGVMAMAFLLWTENTIQSAVQQAARCAAINPIDCGTQSAVQNAAIGWTYGILTTSDTGKVSVNLSATCSSGKSGKAVAITYAVTFLVISTTVAAESCYPSLS